VADAAVGRVAAIDSHIDNPSLYHHCAANREDGGRHPSRNLFHRSYVYSDHKDTKKKLSKEIIGQES
jgi:hypothetical protein